MKHIKTFPTVKSFIKHVGRDRFQQLGHKPQVVSRAIKDDVMPAHWYWGVRSLCNSLGIFPPENLFKGYQEASEKFTGSTQYANSGARSQGEPAE